MGIFTVGRGITEVYAMGFQRNVCSQSAAAVGSDPDSLEFAGGLVQRTLLQIGAAADDLVATFGVSQREPASVFAVWAEREVRVGVCGVVCGVAGVVALALTQV